MISSMIKSKVKKIDLSKNSVKHVEELVATEAPIDIFMNDTRVATLHCSPTNLEELGIGWLLSHAVIASVDEVDDVKAGDNDVRINCRRKAEAQNKAVQITKSVHSSYDSAVEGFPSSFDKITTPFVSSDYKIEAENILRYVKVLNEKSSIFKSTGGTHSAAIFYRGRLVAFAEDIGRHNAVDKAIGITAKKKIRFSTCTMISSGRQPANMVMKAARTGVPILASVAAPIHSGIDVAVKTGVTLVCFARGQRMNVYSHPERVKMN